MASEYDRIQKALQNVSGYQLKYIRENGKRHPGYDRQIKSLQDRLQAAKPKTKTKKKKKDDKKSWNINPFKKKK